MYKPKIVRASVWPQRAEKERRDSLTLSPPLWGDFMWKWHQILFMAEKEKHKTTTVAVCHRCSCSRLGTCVRMQTLCVCVCVAGTPPTPSAAFPFSSPFEVETVTHMLSEELFFFPLLPKRSPPSQVPGRAASPDDANLLFRAPSNDSGELAAFLAEAKQTVSAVIYIHLISVFCSIEHWFYCPDGSRGRHKRQVGRYEQSPGWISLPFDSPPTIPPPSRFPHQATSRWTKMIHWAAIIQVAAVSEILPIRLHLKH